jgi:peptidoglycan DL-endopeptidase CwlO
VRARLALVAVFVGALVGGLIGPGAAAAEPSPAQIEAQIDKKWEQLEPVIEQYNKIHAKLQVNQKKSASLQK